MDNLRLAVLHHNTSITIIRPLINANIGFSHHDHQSVLVFDYMILLLMDGLEAIPSAWLDEKASAVLHLSQALYTHIYISLLRIIIIKKRWSTLKDIDQS